MPPDKKPTKNRNISKGLASVLKNVPTRTPTKSTSGKIRDQATPGVKPEAVTTQQTPGQRYYLNEYGVLTPLPGYAPGGVPGDFVAQVPHRPVGQTTGASSANAAEYRQTPQTSVPRYHNGDEGIALRGVPVEQITQMQEMMMDMGLISPTANVSWGNNDSHTKAALKQIMEVANSEGTDWRTALQQMYQNTIDITGGGYLDEQGDPIEEGSGAGELPPLPPRPYLSNDQELRATLQLVARETLGRKVSDAEADAFVNNFHAMESSMQEAQTTPGGPGMAMQLPTAATSAENYIKGDYGQEAEYHAMATTLESFQNIIKGPFGA